MPDEPIVLPFDEFRAFEPPDRRFLVEDLVVGTGIHMIYGKRGTGKTQLVFTMLASILNGEPFLGKYEIPSDARDARVAYFSVDMPHSHVQDRIEGIADQIARPEDFLIAASDSPVNIRALDGDEEWLENLKAFQPDLVAIDTLHKIHVLDENSSQSVAAIYKALKDVFGGQTAIVLVHHASKSSPDPSAVRDDDEKQRGSSAWIDDSDLGILVERVTNPLSGGISVSFPRVRFCAPQEPVICTMDDDSMLIHPKEDKNAADKVQEFLARVDTDWERLDIANWLQDEHGYTKQHAYRAIREVLD